MESEKLADRTLELDSLARQSIVAPTSGQLADVLARPGDAVSAGTILATLHRSEAPIEARVYLSSQFAGRAEPGQEAVLKLPTFPSRQFGVLHGRLESITAAPLEPRDVRLVPNLFEPVYEARVTLERQYMDAKGRRWPLRPGLGVEATIVESRRTLIGWLLEPLSRGARLRQQHNSIGGPEACKAGSRLSTAPLAVQGACGTCRSTSNPSAVLPASR